MTTHATQTSEKTDVYQLITNLIIDRLESGIIPWKCSWIATNPPANYLSKRPYTGINAFLLGCLNYEHPYFLTFNQVKELGGMIRKGAKSIPVIFYKLLERKQASENETQKVPMLQYYRVFHISDVEGVTLSLPHKEVIHLPNKEVSQSCKTILEQMPHPPQIEHRGNQPQYRPIEDQIVLPPMDRFVSMEAYYQTLFHELIHATGHSSRLNRSLSTDFGSQSYSEEELIAEMGATYLSGLAGVATEGVMDNAAAYIAGWLKTLKNDRKLLITAASKAYKAVGYVLADADWAENSL